MKKFSLAIIFMLMLSFAQLPARASEKFVRGVWVSSVANLDFPSRRGLSEAQQKNELDEIVANCAQMGINAIFFQVHPCSDSLYASKIFPTSIFLTGESSYNLSFDPLAYIIKAAHAKGIELHAWLNPYRVTRLGGDELKKFSPESPQRKHPEYLLQCADGNYFFNPALKEVRNLIAATVEEIMDGYDVDGIHFDDYFYPESPYDDSAYFNKSAYTDVAAWREDNVNALIKQIHDTVKAKNPDVSFGVSPRGVWANIDENPRGSATRGGGSLTQIYCDSLKFISEGWVDYICPQIYWSIGFSAADYKVLLPWWCNAVKGTNTDLYIGMADYRTENASSDSAWYGTGELQNQLELNRAYPEVKGEVHFRYGTMANSELKSFYANVYSGEKQTTSSDPRSDVKIVSNLKSILHGMIY